MSTHQSIDLSNIKTFTSLIKYLRDELDWPIDSDKFDDITFDYQPDELGIDPKAAAKIEQIKQLRPLVTDQPWGIFFIKFEPKRLPVVVLRRILNQLATKKRASSRKADQPSWHMNDLLFISNYGESDHRHITFAHFYLDNEYGDLPSLKVLGWDDADTVLHIDHVHRELKQNLRWPENSSNLDSWRERWSSAFKEGHREVITTSKALSIRLAILATTIRKRVNSVLSHETEEGPFRALMAAFQTALIHDLSDDDFADMYAQTITYGLLSARVSRPAGLVAENLTDMVPVTNPFLRDLLGSFLKIGGRKGKIDFDEVGINDVTQTLRNTNMEAVLRDFGDRNPQEDPVVHFYELFLKEYDAQKRMQRGVFYTPRPVVSYIVRSVHELLQTEFGLVDGLADTITWSEMVKKHKELKIPEGTKPEDPFVCILDPATGTGTFLVEVIDVIYKTMLAKWRKERRLELEIPALWNEYVPKHILPRLYGYELMMAPYAIAHMKIGLKLHETHFSAWHALSPTDRVRIFLTNALEPASDKDLSDQFEEMAPALAHEAKAVNAVKRNQSFTIVIGNPPYAGHSWNLTPSLRRTVDTYRQINGNPIKEKGALQLEKSIQDDYIKFFRLSQIIIDNTKIGIVGLVTSHGFLDNPSLRGMRYSILSSFNLIYVLDLHGNILRLEKTPEGGPDKNVFDIKDTGIAISILCRFGEVSKGILAQRGGRKTEVKHSEIWGEREKNKYFWLQNNTLFSTSTKSKTLEIREPFFLLIPQDIDCLLEYEKGYSIGEIMPIHSKGVVTGRDAFVIDFDERTLLERIRIFTESSDPIAALVKKYKLNPTDWWDVNKARLEMQKVSDYQSYVRPLLYRPFDTRPCFYHPAVFMSPRRPVMKHLDIGDHLNNILLITSRMTKGETFKHVIVSKNLAEGILLSSKTSNNAIVFPLYLYPDDEGLQDTELFKQRTANFTKDFLKIVGDHYGMVVQSDSGDFVKYLGVYDLFCYIISILHSPSFRKIYSDPLSRDFPHVPLVSNIDLFRLLSQIGKNLVAFHLVEAKVQTGVSIQHTKKNGWVYTYATRPLIRIYFIRSDAPTVEKVSWGDDTVWINRAQSQGFQGVPEEVWNFYIGGYQVCQKWLKDRKGRILSADDLVHYHRIVIALHETIRLMKEIDEVIEQHGGWPGAFASAQNAES